MKIGTWLVPGTPVDQPEVCTCPLRASAPPMTKIVKFWELDKYPPHCIRCGIPERRWEDFERSHLFAKVYGGQYRLCNFVPLCRRCNLQCPDEDWATCLVWVFFGQGYTLRYLVDDDARRKAMA